MEITLDLVQELARQIKIMLANESQGVGEVTVVTSLDGLVSLPALKRIGEDETVVEAPLNLLRCYIRKGETAIEWKMGEKGTWQTLIPISTLQGPKGETPVFRTGNAGIEWKYKSEDESSWKELVSIENLRLKFEMLTDLQKEEIRGYSAFQLWQKEPGNEEKNYADYVLFNKKESLEAAAIAEEATTESKKQTQLTVTARQKTEEVTDEARKVKEDTEDLYEKTVITNDKTKITRILTEEIRDETADIAEEAREEQDKTSFIRKTANLTVDDLSDLGEATIHLKDQTAVAVNLTIQATNDLSQTAEQTEYTRIATQTTGTAGALLNEIFIEKIQKGEKVIQLSEVERRLLSECIKEGWSAIEKTELQRIKTKIITDIIIELSNHPMEIRGGIWHKYDLTLKDYVSTGIQAKGDTGQSFKIFVHFETVDQLKAAYPDGTNIDGVAAVGHSDPFNYYAWAVKDGLWQWVDQGQLMGAEGKSSFEVWKEIPGNENKSLSDYFTDLRPYVGLNGNWYVGSQNTGAKAAGTDAYSPKLNPTTKHWEVYDDDKKKYIDTGILGEGISVKVEVVVSTPTEYRLKFSSAEGDFTTPNLQGRSSDSILDIDHVPGAEDITYIYDNVEYPYAVGNIRRYHDEARGKYVMYICLDLTDGVALWQKMGSGSGAIKLISGGTASSRSGVVYKLSGGNAASTGDDDIITGGNASEIFE